MSTLFLQPARYGKDEVHKKFSYEGPNFVCSNSQDACSVEFTKHPWKTENWQNHSFISKAK